MQLLTHVWVWQLGGRPYVQEGDGCVPIKLFSKWVSSWTWPLGHSLLPLPQTNFPSCWNRGAINAGHRALGMDELGGPGWHILHMTLDQTGERNGLKIPRCPVRIPAASSSHRVVWTWPLCFTTSRLPVPQGLESPMWTHTISPGPDPHT